jgi:hypothetical protein
MRAPGALQNGMMSERLMLCVKGSKRVRACLPFTGMMRIGSWE